MENRSTNETVGRNVQTLRKKRGLRLTDLSEKLAEIGHSMNVSTLSKLERGVRPITVADLDALHQVLGTFYVWDLLKDDPEGSQKTMGEGAELLRRNESEFREFMAAWQKVMEVSPGWSDRDLLTMLGLSHGSFEALTRTRDLKAEWLANINPPVEED